MSTVIPTPWDTDWNAMSPIFFFNSAYWLYTTNDIGAPFLTTTDFVTYTPTGAYPPSFVPKMLTVVGGSIVSHQDLPSGKYFTSTDGTSWVQGTGVLTTESAFSMVGYGSFSTKVITFTSNGASLFSNIATSSNVWTSVAIGIPVLTGAAVYHIVELGSALYALPYAVSGTLSASDRLVWKSIDSGITWSLTGGTIPLLDSYYSFIVRDSSILITNRLSTYTTSDGVTFSLQSYSSYPPGIVRSQLANLEGNIISCGVDGSVWKIPSSITRRPL